jgi:hypothetical protein
VSRIWYAAYGSNLSRARFDIYLNGGRPTGATHTYPGCRDASAPAQDVACEVEAELAFGGTSKTWGGGVAFLSPGDAAAKARLYLLTLEQVADVIAQENWLAPGTVTLNPAALPEPVVLDGDHVYGIVLPLAARDGVPVVAVTQSDDAQPAVPSDAYLMHIADGLRDAHGMSDGEIASYLAPKRGIAGALSVERLVEIIAVSG